MLVWLPTTFIVALFLWPPSSRLLMVWVLLPVGGLLTVELASFVIRRIFNKLTTHGPYIKVYPHPGFLASQHKYKARRGDAVAPTAHCVPCLSPALALLLYGPGWPTPMRSSAPWTMARGKLN